ncbi:MAG: M24 family metallopeptidase [Patescibacteria group bacterium]|nr:M24 family metallopeptidase [Patescibacteria group bacterium]
MNTDRSKRINTDKHRVVFFGDGLEKAERIKQDRLKNIPLYLSKAATLQLEDEFTFAEYNYIKAKCKELSAKVKIWHVKSPVDFQRAIKDETEIRLIRKSMQIVEKVFSLVRKEIKKQGMAEKRLADFIKSAGLKLGAEDVSFPPIVASGANAAIPHHVPSGKKLKAGEPVILDFGFKYKNYCSDFTRTVFLKKISAKLETVYIQVEKAYWGAIDYINHQPVSLRGAPSAAEERRGNLPLVKVKVASDYAKATSDRSSPDKALPPRNDTGITGEQVYHKAVEILFQKHLEKYFIHSLGHGTGLEIHELPNLSPNSRDILQENMVFSIEPGVYLPRAGGIRIEDLVYFKNGGANKFINVPTKLKDNIL